MILLLIHKNPKSFEENEFIFRFPAKAKPKKNVLGEDAPLVITRDFPFKPFPHLSAHALLETWIPLS